jgi:hypothetical protein
MHRASTHGGQEQSRPRAKARGLPASTEVLGSAAGAKAVRLPDGSIVLSGDAAKVPSHLPSALGVGSARTPSATGLPTLPVTEPAPAPRPALNFGADVTAAEAAEEGRRGGGSTALLSGGRSGRVVFRAASPGPSGVLPAVREFSDPELQQGDEQQEADRSDGFRLSGSRPILEGGRDGFASAAASLHSAASRSLLHQSAAAALPPHGYNFAAAAASRPSTSAGIGASFGGIGGGGALLGSRQRAFRFSRAEEEALAERRAGFDATAVGLDATAGRSVPSPPALHRFFEQQQQQQQWESDHVTASPGQDGRPDGRDEESI